MIEIRNPTRDTAGEQIDINEALRRTVAEVEKQADVAAARLRHEECTRQTRNLRNSLERLKERSKFLHNESDNLNRTAQRATILHYAGQQSEATEAKLFKEISRSQTELKIVEESIDFLHHHVLRLAQIRELRLHAEYLELQSTALEAMGQARLEETKKQMAVIAGREGIIEFNPSESLSARIIRFAQSAFVEADNLHANADRMIERYQDGCKVAGSTPLPEDFNLWQ